MGWTYSAILTLLVLPSAAQGYPTPVDFDGSLLRWDVNVSETPITYAITTDRSDDLVTYQSTIDEAAALWSSVATSAFAFEPTPEQETAQVTINLRRQLDGSDYSAGYAIFDEYDGKKPKHCSIYVIVEDSLSMTSMAKTFLHEMGHCAGLGHTLIPQAIMSYQLDQNAFALDIDDEAAITRLYPADGSKPQLPPGCAIGAAQQSHRVTLMLLLILPLLGVALRWRASGQSRVSL